MKDMSESITKIILDAMTGKTDSTKTKTIKRGDVISAVVDVCQNDEKTKWLVDKMPDILMTFIIIAKKAEDVIFAEE